MRTKNWQTFLSFSMKIIMVILAVSTLIKGEYVWFIGVLFALILTAFPSVLARDFHIQLPIVFDVAITVSIFFHVIGGYVDWYENIPYYDHFTHFLTSTTISLIGVTSLYILVFVLRITKLPPLFFGIFTVLFTISMGVIWEFLEWGFDLAFGTTLQRGLNDTMLDLLFDTTAGIIIGAVATVRLKTGEAAEMRDIHIGDIKSSLAYRRWKMLTDEDVTLKDKIKTAFDDPIILDGFFDYIVEESKQISKSERDFWYKLKKKDEGKHK